MIAQSTGGWLCLGSYSNLWLHILTSDSTFDSIF